MPAGSFRTSQPRHSADQARPIVLVGASLLLMLILLPATDALRAMIGLRALSPIDHALIALLLINLAALGWSWHREPRRVMATTRENRPRRPRRPQLRLVGGTDFTTQAD